MKKIIAIILSASFLVSIFTGCKKDENVKESVSPSVSESQEDISQIIPTAENASWASKTNFYELFVRSFCDSDGDGIGDFKGVTSKLDYLKDLGIDGIWFMPIMSSTTYHGYDVSDYRNVNSDFGTMDDFKELITACHSKGIKVVIDFVVNHTSSENEWFKSAINDENSPYKDYYIIKDGKVEDDGWHYVKSVDKSYYGLYDSIMPDLNYDCPKVKEEIKDVAKFWLEQGVDGFRLDGSCNIYDDQDLTIAWWKEFSQYVKSFNSCAFIVGENWFETNEKIAPYYTALDSSFDFPMKNNIVSFAYGNAVDYIKSYNDTIAMYTKKADTQKDYLINPTDSIMIGNHDMDRVASALDSTEKAKFAASVQLTLPGTPFVYYGEELGQLGGKVDDYKREPFDWYASSKGEGMTNMDVKFFNPSKYTIANDGISLEEEKDNPDSIYNLYKKLLTIRHENDLLYKNACEVIGLSDGKYAYKFESPDYDYKLLVVHNQNETDSTINITVDGKELCTDTDITAGTAYTMKPLSTIIVKYTSDELPTDLPYEEIVAPDPIEYTVTANVTIPENTPDDDIYIAGSFNGWEKSWADNDTTFVLTKTSSTTATITITGEFIPGTVIEYKFARGSWDKREQNAKGEDLIGLNQEQNRTFKLPSDQTDIIIDCTVEKWSDVE